MTDRVDPLLGQLARLPAIDPTAGSVERVRARAHAQLARIERRRQPVARTVRARILDGALLLTGFVYLAGAVAQAVRLSLALR